MWRASGSLLRVNQKAIAAYPEIEKELRLALQTVGRKLGMFLRRRHSIRQEGERRSIFLRYLGEVASALHSINGVDRDEIYENLLRVAKRKTAEADTKLDEKGRKLDPDTVYGENVLIVEEDQESLEKELLQRSKSRTPDPNENTTEE